MILESLGAGASFLGAFATYAAQGLILARVATAQRDQYHLYCETGEIDAEASGGLWYRTPDRAGMPVVGDWVAARLGSSDLAIVEAVLPRRTFFSRRAAGRREDQQPVAANIDVVFLVCGLDGNFNLRRLERYLTLTVESKAAPVVILNKSDVCDHVPERVKQTMAVAKGVPVIAYSAHCSEGIEVFGEYLGHGRTVALLGSSGVGKSTIVNRLLGVERQNTGEVRQADSRGRHITTRRELLPLPGGGALIDTPGMRELQLWAGTESVAETFDEITGLAAGCRYGDCSHSGEPGCRVAAALMDGSLSADRWQSYRKLLGEAHRHQLLSDALAAREEKRKLKVMYRAHRARFKSERR